MSLIVIEGLDGSGKGTQIKLLYKKLNSLGMEAKVITFPDYSSPSSSLVKMYLAGDFGMNAESVNTYAACSFYAVDRYASYITSWKADYDKGKIILADRYTTSNMIYQLEKQPRDHWDETICWIEDYEYNRLGLPKPDKVIYLDVPVSESQKLLSNRYNGDESKKDIHESNIEFLKSCRESALYSANKLGWKIIECMKGHEIKDIQDINNEILNGLDFQERNI
jgi:dTMP kinase